MRCSTQAVMLALLLLSPVMGAEPPLMLDVWPGAVPGETPDVGAEEVLPSRPGENSVMRITNVTKPTISVFRPQPDTSLPAAVLVCPGGGYNILAWDKEGTEVAQWLNSIGVTAIVLKYRVPRRKEQPKHLAPLQDAQRAMSLVRAHAERWRIDPSRIGILGFSAGGHLSAATATNFDERQYEPLDEIDAVSCRPDFAVLVYPAYLLEGERLAAEIRVGSRTPPTFLAHAGDDPYSPENSIAMYLALKQAEVPAEMHIYSSGGHGFGLRESEHPASTWPARCEQWLRSRGLLGPE